MAAEEDLKRAVRDGDVKSLSADRFRELGVEVDQGLGVDDYASTHWACHYGKAEVLLKIVHCISVAAFSTGSCIHHTIHS